MIDLSYSSVCRSLGLPDQIAGFQRQWDRAAEEFHVGLAVLLGYVNPSDPAHSVGACLISASFQDPASALRAVQRTRQQSAVVAKRPAEKREERRVEEQPREQPRPTFEEGFSEKQLRFSALPQCAGCSAGGAGVRGGRKEVGRGHRPEKLLRPSEPRPADGNGRSKSEG